MNVSKYATFSIEPKRTKSGKKLGRSQQERIYETQLREGLRLNKCVAYKIPDPIAEKSNDSAPKSKVKGGKRPFDTIVWLNNGTTIVYEAKYDHAPKGFGKAQLAEHQREWLEKIYKTGNKAYVVLFVKYKNRVHMLVWPWSYFRTLSKCIGVAEITRLLDDGHSYLSNDKAFPIGAFLDPPHQHLYGLSTNAAK